jgi:hypothetical protein
MVLPRTEPRQAAMTRVAMPASRASFTATMVSTNRDGARYAQERAYLLKAGSAKTRARMQKLAPNPAVKSDATGDVVNVGTDPLTHIRVTRLEISCAPTVEWWARTASVPEKSLWVRFPSFITRTYQTERSAMLT